MNIKLIRPCGEQEQVLARPDVSNDVTERKETYMFFAKNDRKPKSLKYKCLLDLSGGESEEKSGVPKNAGISNDVYENKGQNK